ncbi:MAG TPA: hypothetical protein VKS79_24865 [Gemmataceae bacterium]|nr:hypothetical protein [Gemmataceae bacterium]
MCRLIFVLLLVVMVNCSALAQPKKSEVQPDQIAFGTVYTGGIVEASFMVLEPGKDPKIEFTVTAPKFVKVLNKSTHHQEFGARGDFICGSVWVAIDTSASGEFMDVVVVTLGQSTVKVPVSATVKAPRPELTRLLVANTPFTRYSTNDGTIFKEWTDLVNRSPLDASYLAVERGKPVLRDLDLDKFDTILLGCEGICEVTPEDIKKVRAFAESGGRVIVAANHFFHDTITPANKVLDGYGLQIRNEEANGKGNDVRLEKEEFSPDLVKAGVKSLHFFRASPIGITDARGRVVVKAVEVGQKNDGFVAIGRAGEGSVAAIGESLWWSWISAKQAGDTDNAKLLRWLIVPRKRDL